MIKAIINGILNLIISILDIILIPVNALFENLFPDVTSMISTFNSIVQTYVGGGLAYFFSMLPPIFKGLLVTFITFIIAYYGVYYTYIGIKKIFDIIQKIKFW